MNTKIELEDVKKILINYNIRPEQIYQIIEDMKFLINTCDSCKYNT
jgi:hypothetical protein